MSNIISESDWLATPLGRHVLTAEQGLYDAAVADIFGFNAAQLGLPQADLLQNSRIPFRLLAGENGRLRCNFDQLPLATNSLDLLLLPHILEFAENPHQVLRDAERALVPEGHLIISGFNPFSLWGLHRLCGRRVAYPWRGQFISLMRLKDWLALLGLEVVGGRMTCYALPVKSAKWLARLDWMNKAGDRWWPMMGGVYFLVAKKRVTGVRLIRPHWSGKHLAQVLMPRPRPTQRIESQKEGHDEA